MDVLPANGRAGSFVDPDGFSYVVVLSGEQVAFGPGGDSQDRQFPAAPGKFQRGEESFPADGEALRRRNGARQHFQGRVLRELSQQCARSTGMSSNSGSGTLAMSGHLIRFLSGVTACAGDVLPRMYIQDYMRCRRAAAAGMGPGIPRCRTGSTAVPGHSPSRRSGRHRPSPSRCTHRWPPAGTASLRGHGSLRRRTVFPRAGHRPPPCHPDEPSAVSRAPVPGSAARAAAAGTD